MNICRSSPGEVISLEQIASKIGSGATPRGGKSAYKTVGTSLIRSLNVHDLMFEYNDLAYIDDDQAEQLRNVDVRQGDILLNITGASAARCCLAPADVLPARVNQHVAIIRPMQDRADPRYLMYSLVCPENKNRLLALAQSGATREALTQDDLRRFRMSLPPIDIQRKVASVLQVYDDLIVNNLRRIAILEETARAIYREWFVEFRYPGHRSVKIEGSTQCDMPTGWVEATVGDIAEETRQSVDPCKLDPATPYVGLAHIPRRSIALCDWSRAYEVQSTKLCFQKGDILFGKIRPYFHKVAVAPVDGVCSSDTIVIRPTKPEYYYLVLCCVSSDEFVAYSVQTSSPGTKMPRANWELMRAFPISIPSASLLKRFNDVIGNLMDLICHLVLSTRTLRLTRDLLLPRLISGELDVSDIAMSTEVDNL